jgi:hypothetical protein
LLYLAPEGRRSRAGPLPPPLRGWIPQGTPPPSRRLHAWLLTAAPPGLNRGRLSCVDTYASERFQSAIRPTVSRKTVLMADVHHGGRRLRGRPYRVVTFTQASKVAPPLIVPHRHPYSPLLSPLGMIYWRLVYTLMEARPCPSTTRLFPPRPHPGSAHPLAVAALPGLRQPSPPRRRPRRRQVAPYRRPGRPAPPGVCGRTARLSGSGPMRPCRTAPDDAD